MEFGCVSCHFRTPSAWDGYVICLLGAGVRVTFGSNSMYQKIQHISDRKINHNSSVLHVNIVIRPSGLLR